MDQTIYSAIHRISVRETNCVIHSIDKCLVDSVIHSLIHLLTN